MCCLDQLKAAPLHHRQTHAWEQEISVMSFPSLRSTGIWSWVSADSKVMPIHHSRRWFYFFFIRNEINPVFLHTKLKKTQFFLQFLRWPSRTIQRWWLWSGIMCITVTSPPEDCKKLSCFHFSLSHWCKKVISELIFWNYFCVMILSKFMWTECSRPAKPRVGSQLLARWWFFPR